MLLTTTVNVADRLIPLESVAVNVTTVLPTGVGYALVGYAGVLSPHPERNVAVISKNE
jgi:hypothetical protein